MFETLTTLSAFSLIWAFGVALFAGFIKGAVGFAMPMIMISGLSAVISAEAALAALILPTFVTNIIQALRQGWRAALQSMNRFRYFLIVGAVCISATSQLVPYIPSSLMFLILGLVVTVFAVVLLSGKKFKIPDHRRTQTEIGVGIFAGLVGGVSGIWGPPTVAYLTALNTPKAEQVRAQGVIYGLGAMLLIGAHLNTGVLSKETAPLSVILLIPAFVGIWLGFKAQDRLNQTLFRRLTLIVLIVAGLNLIRRGLIG